MDEMSEKFFSKFGVKDLGDIIEGGIEEKEFLGRITSCNKVSNGVLLDEYQHNLDAANSHHQAIQQDFREEIVWLETQMPLRRSSF